MSGLVSNQFSALGAIADRPVDSLHASERNPRKHPAKQIAKLCGCINEFGFLIPILARSDGEIIAGEARVEAARRLGMASVPCIIADHLTDQQVRAFRVIDNRLPELASWDAELLAVEFEEVFLIDDAVLDMSGWEMPEIDLIVADAKQKEAKAEVEDIPEVEENAVSVTGDLWQLGKHRLLCGSSLDAVAWDVLMDGRSADMMFTDAPYNVPVNGHVSGLGKVQHAEFQMASGEMSEEQYVVFLTDHLKPAAACLKDGAILDCCIDFRHLYEMLTAARAAGLTLLNDCVWVKNNAGMGSLYRSANEHVLIFKKGAAPHINNIQLGKFGRYRTNVWEYPGMNSFGKGRMEALESHPTVKNADMVADAIRDVTHRGHIVIDPFMGSGTTIIAAERTARIAYGFDIEPRYVDVAIRRWEKATKGQATLAASGETFAAVTAQRLMAASMEATHG